MKYLPSLVVASLLLVTTAQAQQRAASSKPTLSAPVPSPASPPAPPQPSAPATNTGELTCSVLTGHVTNNLNQPLMGATVMLRSRTKGFNPEACITNAEGQYMVTSKQPIPINTVLEISAGGYDTFAMPLANCQPIEASLTPLPGTRFKSDGRIKKTSASGKIH